MPSLEKHIQLSLQRTGKEFRELHEWLDGKELSVLERIERHSVSNAKRFLPVIEEKFGKEGAEQYLQHLEDDYGNSLLVKVLGRLGNKRIIKNKA